MLQFIAYYRVSTKTQGLSGLGLEAQKESIEKYVRSQSGEILQSFTDIASGKDDNRAELLKAIRAAKKHKAILIVKRLDRLSRGGFKIAVDLEEIGVKYIESDSPNDNELLRNIKLAIAKDERSRISERTKAALMAKKARGEKLGNINNLTDEGRKKGAAAMKKKASANMNNRRAKIVIDLLSADKKTLQQMADYLNKNGYLTARGKEFTPVQISRLRNNDNI
ncbi:Site-specific DNA recombinase [Maribacter dokdonensis]|uniref:Site-specific DNA recombinase n=1 Tax=Maribacter dokdonensis TaxID=320912 RepID=A0ABY0V0J6_9FLAO|nr:recombinase family protein [Maribacter dokdonensis]SDT47026.1 Site-specific DNA recombinase [Maribacter dokdonensis]